MGNLYFKYCVYCFIREKELEFVTSQNTTSDFDGWLRFNVTRALISWAHYAYPNRGLYVSVHSLVNSGKYYFVL